MHLSEKIPQDALPICLIYEGLCVFVLKCRDLIYMQYVDCQSLYTKEVCSAGLYYAEPVEEPDSKKATRQNTFGSGPGLA